MTLQIIQKHQFYSEKYDVTFDILKMSNNEMYLNIKQIESVFLQKFDDYMTDQCKNSTYKKTYPKAVQFYDVFRYSTPEDFEKDMILDFDNIKWSAYSYISPFIYKHNEKLGEELLNFYKSIVIFNT